MSQRRLHGDYDSDGLSVRPLPGPEGGEGSELMEDDACLVKASREEKKKQRVGAVIEQSGGLLTSER